MIPKIIHYCWLSGDAYPANIKRCMASWKKLSDYEFIHWNLERFPLSKSIWVKEAFEAKRYAFAADYIRLYALYHYGGIYLDSDVEVVQSFDRFLDLPEMVGFENNADTFEMAALGAEPHAAWVKLCLDYYENRHFIMEDGKYDMLPIPYIVKKILRENGYRIQRVETPEEAKMVADEKVIPVLPETYFSPKSYKTGRVKLSLQTYSIHHFVASWHGFRAKFAKLRHFAYRVLGTKITERLLELYGKSWLYRE
jgi:hypothetical protein